MYSSSAQIHQLVCTGQVKGYREEGKGEGQGGADALMRPHGHERFIPR